MGVSYDGYTHRINPNAAELTTIERKGRCEKEQPKVGPKGKRAGASELKDTESTEDEESATAWEFLTFCQKTPFS